MRALAVVLAACFVLPLPACGDGSAASGAAGEASGAAAEVARCHAAWDRVVSERVVRGGVDYAAVAADRGDLDAFLACVRRVDPGRLPEPARLAFLVNAYNALVVDAVLARYPGLESVRDVDGFFDEETHPVGGRERTLDDLEAEARKLDPRVHFAVVCASTSCPDLLDGAFTGPALDRQLRRQTEAFLADPTKGLRYDRAANVLHLSSIFQWYAGDFTGGSTVVAYFARGGVLDWVIDHLADRRLAAELDERRPSIRYMEYDWSLNDR
ncbi:MAG TPA: DUF547 domain-containing protein [Thermoanaerobaculia bacterium]|nr:DUF547 domain-containing protein [Thermoanaerobaculia bacterium]